MSTTPYERILEEALRLTPEEQAQLIHVLKATTGGSDETGERRGQGSTGAPLGEPQPYSSPRTSSEQ